MNKKIFTLLILLLLLPVTALAADEIKLFIGGQQITESGCYEKNLDGDWTKVDGTEPDNGQFSYDAATFTLTLNQAEITNNQTVNVAEGYTYYGSVIAFSQTADVSLTIVVSQGTSNITGTGGIRVVSEAGDASLSISGPGSLEVNVDKNDSGISLIGSKNVNLNIDGADVKTLAAYYYGVDLHAGDGFKAAAVVNNGKLTAGGSGGIGIYYRWTNPSDSGTSSLTVSGNAVVDTRDSKILIASQASEVQVSAGSDGNGGIVFDGKSGTVYGKVELQEDLEIGTDETLTIGKDASLTVPDGKTLTNNGTINVESGGKLEGTTTGQGTLKIAPTITTQPQDVEVKENETATFTVEATGSEPLSYQWQESKNGSSWTDITGETNATYTTEKTTMDMNGYQYRCVVKNNVNEVTSNAAILTVKHNLVKVEAKAPTCTEPGNIEYWYCKGCDKYFSDAEGKSEINLAQTVINATGHKLTKTEAKEPTCTEAGNKEYWTCESCGSLFRDEVGSAEIKLEDVVIPATGHHYVNGYCTECGHRDPDYRPDPISYYNIYVEDVCEGVDITTSKNVVREGGTISLYVEKDTANYTFDNFKVYYKRSYYGGWEELKEGTQPGEYPIKNIWTHIYIKAEGAEEKEDPTGIESIEGVKVYTKDGSLYVQTPQREQVIIVGMSGAVVKNEEQIGLKQYHGLQPGIYIVRVGDKAYKVRLN